MRILPRPRRQAIFAVYAFCRLVDDVADGDAPDPVKHTRLDAWEDEVARIAAGAPRTAVGRALLAPVTRYDLPVDELGHILEGMRMDVEGALVAPEREVLARYVRCVAGSVGLLSMRIFGAWRGETSSRFALALAEGLQLVNILRDVEEDAARGRLYLPRDLLRREGVPLAPQSAVGHPALPRVREAIGRVAAERFGQARVEITSHSRLRLAPALLMMGPYGRMLDDMRAAGWVGPPPRLSQRRKVWLGLRCALRGAGA
ncbi:squalene/phytoene synthase family protein [Rhodobacteraceae bacterium MCCB 386]|nr:squalene/phytoene synthase family protein [Roseitranquillus sediminis]